MGYILSQTMHVYLRCARRSELPNLTDVSRTIPKKMRYVGSRPFKVIKFGTNRTSIYDFVLTTVTVATVSDTLSELQYRVEKAVVCRRSSYSNYT